MLGTLTIDDAIAIEKIEAENLAAQIEGLAECGAIPDARCLRIDNIVASSSSAKFGRKLNHVVGLGLGSSCVETHLSAVDAFYADGDIAPEIDICPFVQPSTLGALEQRGYRANAFSNTYVLADFASAPVINNTSRIEVRQVQSHEREAFIEWSVAGFSAQSPPRSRDLLRFLALSALHRRDISLFAAEVDGKVVGTAALSIIAIDQSLTAHLLGASTLPEFRNRGVQSALLAARLNQAAASKVKIVSLTARPRNGSSRNAERAGFRLAYSKISFARVARP